MTESMSLSNLAPVTSAADKGPVVGVTVDRARWHQVRVGRLGRWADPGRDREDVDDPSSLVAAQVDAVRAAMRLCDWGGVERLVSGLPVWTPAGVLGGGGFKQISRLGGAYVRNLSGSPDIGMDVAREALKSPSVKACWPDPSATGLQVVIHVGVWETDDEFRAQWLDAVRRWALRAGYADHIAIGDCDPRLEMPLSDPKEMAAGHRWAAANQMAAPSEAPAPSDTPEPEHQADTSDQADDPGKNLFG